MSNGNLNDIVNQIEIRAGQEARAARAAYKARMKAMTTAFHAEQRQAAAVEREELKRVERWRVGAIAAVDPSRPVIVADIKSVKRAVVDGFETKAVSLAATSMDREARR